MKTLFKAIAIASLASTAAVAQAEVTGSLGVNSSYQFRGLELADGMTTNASLGFNMAGISVGIHLTDADNSTLAYQNGGLLDQNGDPTIAVSDFTETDIVLGYGMNVMGTDVRLSYTDYSYNFGNGVDDGGQTEFSVGITASGLAIDYVDGEDSDMAGMGETDYDVLTLGYNVGNVGITLGAVEADAMNVEYNYFEISTGTELFGLDATVTVTNTFSEDNLPESGATLVVGVSKSLNL
jgi:hypothetical protein